MLGADTRVGLRLPKCLLHIFPLRQPKALLYVTKIVLRFTEFPIKFGAVAPVRLLTRKP